MFIGMCTCGHCQFCGYQWAPPVDTLITTSDFARVQLTQERFQSRLYKPRWKRHADGSWTQLPSFAAMMRLGAS